MRIIFLLIVLSFQLRSFAQDDMPDYRSKRENFSKVTEKDIRSDAATFTMSGIDESVGKSTLQNIPVTNYTSNSITFSNNNISVTIKAAPFDPKKHKLGMFDKHLVKIDNKPFYGDYGNTPATYIQSITVVIDNDTVPVPPTAYADIYNPDFVYTDAVSGKIKSHNNVYLSNDKHKLYVYLLSRDDSGGYEVTWVFQDKQYRRRIIDFGFLK